MKAENGQIRRGLQKSSFVKRMKRRVESFLLGWFLYPFVREARKQLTGEDSDPYFYRYRCLYYFTWVGAILSWGFIVFRVIVKLS
ncbi:hypothetical protein [Dehalococcoides mccartyi]|uniref:Uncharacterized protein n=1 Tax=Dehalococcoides mccartyi TaxID=61435 RepID=A0AB38Z9Y9_9CHLR|nr:hypothetical protein [Dehalococcoides mccartyi]WRO07398.1 hypothetical protein VLL09_00420 [Dehalococcoides mccartyi]